MQANCKNPFHFCKKILNLSKQRRTLCACSDSIQQHVESGFSDIRHFLGKYPKRVSAIAKISTSPIILLSPPKSVDALARDDMIRKQHDRGKKKKKQRFI